MEALRLASSTGIKSSVVADAYAGMGRCMLEEDKADYAENFFNKALRAGPSSQTRILIEKELKDLSSKK